MDDPRFYVEEDEPIEPPLERKVRSFLMWTNARLAYLEQERDALRAMILGLEELLQLRSAS